MNNTFLLTIQASNGTMNEISFQDFQKKISALSEINNFKDDDFRSPRRPILPGSHNSLDPRKLRARLPLYRSAKEFYLRKFRLKKTGSNNCKICQFKTERFLKFCIYVIGPQYLTGHHCSELLILYFINITVLSIDPTKGRLSR